MRTTIIIPDAYYNKIKKRIKQEGFLRVNDFINHTIREYLRRDLLPCNICNLKKENLVNETCIDCYDTLPDEVKSNYHPLKG